MRLTTLQREQNAHEDNIWAVGWTSKDGLLTGSVDESCKQWSFESDNKGFTERKHITGQELGVVGLDVNASGDLAAISTLDCFIRLLNLKNNEDQVGISLTSPETWSLAFNPQPEANQLAVAAGCKGGIRLYKTNVLENEEQREICHLAAQVSAWRHKRKERKGKASEIPCSSVRPRERERERERESVSE